MKVKALVALGLAWLQQASCADDPRKEEHDPDDEDDPRLGMEGSNTQQRISIANMSCDFFEQPLNHFHIPKEKSPSYMQRYCVYNEFVKDTSNMTSVPIFFYTGMLCLMCCMVDVTYSVGSMLVSN